MADHPSSFERMIANNGPIQESILRYLTRWDFRNLQLAGVRISINRQVRRQYQIPDRCDGTYPEDSVERCINTTQSFDEIRACEGHPEVDWEESELKKSTAAQKISPCLQDQRFSDRARNPDNEPNTNKYPIHTKICRGCRDHLAAIVARDSDQQLRMIADFGRPLCEQHSLEHANRFPINACRCLDYMNNTWRCFGCFNDTLFYMKNRVCFLENSIRHQNERTPWSQPLAYLRGLWSSVGASEVPFCPIDGCMQRPWLDETRNERMQLCLGCNAISKIQ